MTSRLDTSDPALKEIVAKVRSDTDPASWCVLGYEGKAKIILKNSGSGSFMGAMEELEDGAVNYCLLRVEGGRDQESKSVKFVSVVWVGPSVGGMQKGRVGAHKADILEPILGWTVVDMQVDDMDDLTEDIIREKLKKASGANYDLGSNAGGKYESNAKAIQQGAKGNYGALEKEGNIGPVKYETFARPKETPVDFAGRPMVAPPSQAKANTVMRDEEKIGRERGVSAPPASARTTASRA